VKYDAAEAASCEISLRDVKYSATAECVSYCVSHVIFAKANISTLRWAYGNEKWWIKQCLWALFFLN
jgi:hypothetical protein